MRYLFGFVKYIIPLLAVRRLTASIDGLSGKGGFYTSSQLETIHGKEDPGLGLLCVIARPDPHVNNPHVYLTHIAMPIAM